MKIVFKLSTTVFPLTCRTLSDKKIISFLIFILTVLSTKNLHFYITTFILCDKENFTYDMIVISIEHREGTCITRNSYNGTYLSCFVIFRDRF